MLVVPSILRHRTFGFLATQFMQSRLIFSSNGIYRALLHGPRLIVDIGTPVGNSIGRSVGAIVDGDVSLGSELVVVDGK